MRDGLCSSVFFFNDTATTEIYTLSLHDALPISQRCCGFRRIPGPHRYPSKTRGRGWTSRSWRRIPARPWEWALEECERDRKSTRLNSSHLVISYAVFCLKKKNIGDPIPERIALY